jgi:hypothetical protein
MPPDYKAWRAVVRQVTNGLADEALQRRAWFGVGPEISSPDEMFNQFFDDAAFEEFLSRVDSSLNAKQLEAGRRLLKLMTELSDETTQHIEPSTLIDDPRWRQIRLAASEFRSLLDS